VTLQVSVTMTTLKKLFKYLYFQNYLQLDNNVYLFRYYLDKKNNPGLKVSL